MPDNKIDKVLDGIQDIKVSQAVHYEQITQLSKRMDAAYSRLDKAEGRITEADKKIDEKNSEITDKIQDQIKPLIKKLNTHDKIVGAVVIVASILVGLIRLKIL